MEKDSIFFKIILEIDKMTCYLYKVLSRLYVRDDPFDWVYLVDRMYLVFKASVAQLVELLICNQWVGGSSPFAGSMVGFPSGQREQTVNLSATPSEVQILPPPPNRLIVALCRRFRIT